MRKSFSICRTHQQEKDCTTTSSPRSGEVVVHPLPGVGKGQRGTRTLDPKTAPTIQQQIEALEDAGLAHSEYALELRARLQEIAA